MILHLGITGASGMAALVDTERRYNGLVCGEVGSGKSYLARALVRQVLNEGELEVLIADPKNAGDFSDLDAVVAQGPDASVELITDIAGSLTSGRVLPRFVVVDEFAAVQLRQVGEDQKAARDRVDRVHSALGSICLMGRALGVRLLLVAQRPDTSTIPGWMRDQCSWRVALGWLSSDGYRMLGFESQLLPPTKFPGYGYVSGIDGCPPGQASPLHVAF